MKKLLAILLILTLALGLVACGGNPDADPSDPGTDNAVSDTDKTPASGDAEKSDDAEEEWKPLEVAENKFIVSDYLNQRVVVYDLDLVPEGGDLSLGEVWALEGLFSASVKYRENTKYGTVVLTTHNGPVITDFETKEEIWCGGAGKAGSNPHSVEILPSGNVVTASSTDGLVRIFNTYDIVTNDAPIKFKTYQLPGAHGVLWDPENEYLWAIGDDDLIAYVVKEQDGMEVLQQVNGVGAPLPTKYGHDLSPDLMDSNYLWCTTNSGVYYFDKEANEFVEKYNQYAKLNKGAVKGFGNNKNGNFIFSQAKGDDDETLPTGAPGWSTDIITFGYWKSESFLYIREIQCKNAAFYKARVLCGDYQ